jgi:ferredoxin
VIAQPCADSKDASCVDVCPVDCIHPTRDEPRFDEAAQLYIDPENCIDCGACVPECPVEAIFAELDLPAKWDDYTQVNAAWCADHPQ